MNEITRPPPSGYKVEQAMATWAAARARLLAEDSGLEHNEAALEDLLGAAEGDVEDVLARLLRAARDAKAMAEASATLIDDMQARKARFQRRNDAFRATAFAILTALDRQKIELPDLSASIRAGQPSVQIIDDTSGRTLAAVGSGDKAYKTQLKHGGNVAAAKLKLTPEEWKAINALAG